MTQTQNKNKINSKRLIATKPKLITKKTDVKNNASVEEGGNSPQKVQKTYFKWYVLFVYPSSKTTAVAEKIRAIESKYIKNSLSMSEISKEVDLNSEFVFVYAALKESVKRKILEINGVCFFYKNNTNPIVVENFSDFLTKNKTRIRSIALKNVEKQKAYQTGERVQIKEGFLEGAVGIIIEVLLDNKIKVELDLYSTNMITEVDMQNIEFVD